MQRRCNTQRYSCDSVGSGESLCDHADGQSCRIRGSAGARWREGGFSLLETLMALWITGVVMIVAVGSLVAMERAFFQLTRAVAGIDDSWVLYHAMASDIRSAVSYSFANDEISIALQDGSTATYRLSPRSNLIERSRNGYGAVPVASHVSGLSYAVAPGTGVRVTVRQGGSELVTNLFLVFARGSF